ncbi:DUF1304 domain-containing protein [Curtanaerobium respiraculi]|uniref:DUF1304 domain-containing protein n=1 Tax=Curtanaerobium respiraculi TaxID=2949669 RepID=UPI0024B3C163|nr:DUF1304 family protein [Curtanaerobium respiraculi]
MALVNMILVVLVALEFFFIFYLETIATTSKKTSETFGMDISELKRDSVSTLFKNQGVYNALLGVLLLVFLFGLHSQAAVVSVLVYILCVAAYGAATSNPKILLKQGCLAAVALILILVFGL